MRAVAYGDVCPAVLELKKSSDQKKRNVPYELTVLQFRNNARRDNLEGFWSPLYGTHHALMWVDSFFENVPTHLFEQRALAEGEKGSNTVLHFQPNPPEPMIVACLWSHWSGKGESELDSFVWHPRASPERVWMKF